MSNHKSTRKDRDFRRDVTEQYQSLVRFDEMLKLRSMAESTRSEYVR